MSGEKKPITHNSIMDISQKPPLSIDYSGSQNEQSKRNIYLAKVGVLIILTFGSAFLLGQYLSYSFYQNVLSLPTIAVPLVTTFAVFLTFFFHSVLFVRKKNLLALMAIGSWACIAVNFFDLANPPLLVGIALCLLLFLYTAFSVKNELQTHIKIRFVYSLNNVTTKIVLAIAILLAATLYGTFASKELDENNFLLPKSVFVKVVPVLQTALRNVLGDIDFNKPLRQTAEEQVDKAIVEQVGEGKASFVPPAQRQQLIDTYVTEMQNGFYNMFGVEIDETKPLSDALYDALLYKFNTADPGIKSTALLILAILFILSIQALAIVIRIVLIPVAFLVYEILLRTKFAHIVYENATKEIVTL